MNESKSNALQRLWEDFARQEKTIMRNQRKSFKNFFNKLPSNISYGWMQCRMGLFIAGNDWLPISRLPWSLSFDNFQKAYRAFFGCEASVNFNLSRAALYHRQAVRIIDLDSQKTSDSSEITTLNLKKEKLIARTYTRLLIKLLHNGQTCDIDLVDDTVVISIGKEFAELLLPSESFTVIDTFLRERVENNKETESPDYSLLERLMACRQQTFYKVVSEWTKRGPDELSEDLKFPKSHVKLAIFLLTLEYMSYPDIDSRWRELRDEFLAKTPDELLLSSLGVLQGSLFWLRLIAEPDLTPFLLNIIMPPIITETNIPQNIPGPDQIVNMYNGLQVPPDLVALGGNNYDPSEVNVSFQQLEKTSLKYNTQLLHHALFIVHNTFYQEYYTFKDCIKRWGYSDKRNELKDKFGLNIKKGLTITTLFPADSEQLDIFMHFCRTKLTTIGKYEGRPLRFSVILGNELHLNLYFNDDLGSRSDFKDKDGGFDLAAELSPSNGDPSRVNDDDKAIARIRGNAGLFQLPEYHLFCHIGKRHQGKILDLSHVVRDHPFIQKAPIGNLFSVEVQYTGVMRVLQNRMEICRITHGEWSFKSEEQVKKLRNAIVDKLRKIYTNLKHTETEEKAWEKPIEILLRVIQRLRDQSHGGTMIVCGSDYFQRWEGKIVDGGSSTEEPQGNTIISRHTPAIKNWDGLTVEEGHLEILTELLGQDGATFIVLKESGKLQAYGKYVLHPVYRNKNNGSDEVGPIKVFNPEEFIYRPAHKKICEYWCEQGWADWEAMYHKWGTRHLSSTAFSALSEDKSIVITISEDGDVSCFDDACYRKDLSWR